MEEEVLRGEKKERKKGLTACKNLRWTLSMLEKVDKTLTILPVLEFKLKLKGQRRA